MSQRRVSIQEALAGPFDGISHLVIVHERRWRFRWLSIIQLLLGGICVILLLPVILYLAIRLGLLDLDGGDDGGGDSSGDSEPDKKQRTPPEPKWLTSPRSWFFTYWHELTVQGFRPELGAVPEFEARYRPESPREEWLLVARALEQADAAGMSVLEKVGTQKPEERLTVERWFGAQPLLARPEVRHEAQAIERLRPQGIDIHEADGQLDIRWKEPVKEPWEAALMLLFAPLMLPFYWKRGLSLRDLWGDFRRQPPRETRITVRPDGIEVVRERQGHVSLREQVPGRELLGVTFSATLGHDRSAQFQDPSLRLVCRGGRVVTVVSPGLGASGRHLRELLIAATLRLRREHPAAGLPHEPQRPTRCPQCGRPHVMRSGEPCPGCGAFAGVRW